MFKMADNRVKRECKIPKRFIDEFAEAKPKNYKKLKATDRNIYPVEITEVDKARNMVKIHFKGYSEKFDEWRPCDENNLPVIRLEPMSRPTDDSLSDRLQAFCERVTGRSSESCTQGAERIPKYVLKFKSMMTFSMQVLEGLRPNDIREINSYMKFFQMKLWIFISAQSGMSGS